MKTCTKCLIEKSLGEFPKMKASKDGFHYYCKSCMKEYKKNYYAKNSEKLKQSMRRFYRANIEKHAEYYRKYGPKYRKENVQKLRANNARRHAAKLKATPRWANQEVINQIYLDCPIDHQVDHIVPLQGNLVCGLHVEKNLQYLTPFANISKGNKWEPLEDSKLFDKEYGL